MTSLSRPVTSRLATFTKAGAVVAVLVGIQACFPDPKLLDRDDVADDVAAAPDATTDIAPGEDAVGCTSNGDCANLAGPCIDAVCTRGGCVTTVRDGSSCDDGDLCTTDDVCEGTTCIGFPKVCDEPAACRSPGACDATTGACIYPTLGNGTACDDGDRCTAGDSCLDGACVATRSKNDALGDWVSQLRGTHHAQLAGLVSTTTGIALLVNFQRDSNNRADIGFGGNQTVFLPEGSDSGIALFSLRFNGQAQSATLVAHAETGLRAASLSVLANDDLVISGSFVGTMQAGSQITMDSGPDGEAMFGLKLQNFQTNIEYWVFEGRLQEGVLGAPVFQGGGQNCLIAFPVGGGSTFRLRNERGTVATLDPPENTFAAVWLTWLPGCGSIVGVQRILRTPSDGGVFLTAVHAAPDGSVAIAGISTAGLAFGALSETPAELFKAVSFKAFGLHLDADRRVDRRVVVTDETPEGFAWPWAVMSRRGDLLMSYDVLGRSFVESLDTADPSPRPVAGNPDNAFDVSPRANLAGFSATGSGDWSRMLAFNDYEAKGGSTLGALATTSGGRILTTTSYRFREWVGPNDPGIVRVRAFNNAVIVWEAAVIKAELGAAEGFYLEGPTFIAAVPGSESAVVAGTVSGKGEVGPDTLSAERRAVATNAESQETVVFVMRLNSDDGVGCGQ